MAAAILGDLRIVLLQYFVRQHTVPGAWGVWLGCVAVILQTKGYGYP